MIITLLSRNLLALPVSDSVAFFFSLVFSLLLGNLLAVLNSCVVGHLPVLCVALLLVLSLAFLLGNILAVLFGHLVAHLLGHIIADLLLLGVALFLRHQGSNSFLNIMAFVNWNRTADRLVGYRADLLRSIVSIRNRLGVALLLGHLLAILLGHLLTDLSGLLPAFLSGFIPALLISIHIGALLLSHSLTLLLSYSVAGFFIPSVTNLLILDVALLLFSVLLQRFLDSVALLLRNIMALLLSFQTALLLGHIINLGFSDSVTDLLWFIMTFLLMLSVALLLIPCRTFLLMPSAALFFRYILALHLRHTIYPRNLLSATFLLIIGGSEGLLDVLAFLARFIPTLLIIHSCTTGYSCQGTGYQAQ